MKIAIYNSYPFHFEVYGYILSYATKNRCDVTIYSSLSDKAGWAEWYLTYFKYEEKHIDKFLEEYATFDKIFLVTDDDPEFPSLDSFHKKKVIAIQHYYVKARPDLFCIPIRPFYSPVSLKNSYVIPFMPFGRSPKPASDVINIAVLGHVIGKYDIASINKMYRKDGKELVFHFVSRSVHPDALEGIAKKCSINENIGTKAMLEILVNSDYILIDGSESKQKDMKKKKTSGALGLAWSFLIPIIISYKSNKLFNFRNVVQYRFDLPRTLLYDINIDDIQKERDQFMDIEKYISLH